MTRDQTPDRVPMRDLAAFADPDGVLSVYVTTDPREETTGRPAWRIRIQNQLSDLRERLTLDPKKHWSQRVFKRLEEIRPDIDRLLAAREHGRGRALFASIGSGEVRTFHLQQPLSDLVVLATSAYVRPLVKAAEIGAPAGVLAVARGSVRMLDLRYGIAHDVDKIDQEGEEADPAQRRQGTTGNPLMGSQRSSSARDRYARKADDHTVRFVRRAAAQTEEKARELGWEALVVTGEMKLAEEFAAALHPKDRRPVVVLGEDLQHAPVADLTEAVLPALHAIRKRRAEELASSAKDAALSGGHGVLGLEDTLGALRDGAAGTLFLEENREWEGVRASDGRLFTVDGVPVGVNGLVPEQRLGERMIETALRADCRVTMLDADSAGPITEYDGIAAQLRW